MSSLFFINLFLTKPKQTGAILPSSKYLANRMVEHIDFKHSDCIVEYGPGTGIFTDLLLGYRHPLTTLVIIENDEDFYLFLKQKYKNEENLFIIHGLAEDASYHLERLGIQSVNYVISGLPFANLPPNKSEEIMASTLSILEETSGTFITFQYSLCKLPLFKRFFPSIDIKKVRRNIPPANVLICNTSATLI
ncbi:class I SAM-dependent methyltransferase [Peribacillus alkalitolerans]|uniref:class I SAM-dependent methyltransferase n=1 Tax=Peribacillus alkalitolerans TaxID=1550385 RepID=UPI0013D49DE1|nr:rRNA adenine N-6-methyltransferase family protein [Peribacillus alkalitolerans]